jgi:hypothetical protein
MLESFECGVNSHTNFINIHQLVQNFLRKTEEHGYDGTISMPCLVIYVN